MENSDENGDPAGEDDRSRPRKTPEGRPLKVALIFGVVAATLELGLLLWFAYC